MIESTSKFTVAEIVYQDDLQGFAVAKGYWDGDKSRYRIGIRWFEDGGMGYPQTFGKPQWFLMPDNCRAQFEGLVPGSRSVALTLVEASVARSANAEDLSVAKMHDVE